MPPEGRFYPCSMAGSVGNSAGKRLTTMLSNPNNYQTWSTTESGELVCCGVNGMPRVNQRSALRCHRKWMAWREQYLRDNPGRYPLRDVKQVAWFAVEVPAGTGRAVHWFRVA